MQSQRRRLAAWHGKSGCICIPNNAGCDYWVVIAVSEGKAALAAVVVAAIAAML